MFDMLPFSFTFIEPCQRQPKKKDVLVGYVEHFKTSPFNQYDLLYRRAYMNNMVMKLAEPNYVCHYITLEGM